ncbi:MAG: hypothetical protein DHS20C18_42990 [Saprospiraceae bacterium]|nr:MAG: hypothetical protein DHS20C18_42990 [Saprospiraceae bacterium]
MKNLLLFVFATFVFTACNNEKKPATETVEEPELIVEEVEEMPNESDLDIDEALSTFDAGSYGVASNYIKRAIEDLQEESIYLPVETKANLEKSVKDLQALANKVKAGEIKDRKTLEDHLVHAEMLVANNYLVFTQVYGAKDPARAESSLRKAIDKMETAAQWLEGASKKEAEQMIAESKTVLEKSDRKANEIGNTAGKQVEKITKWLENNAKKIGLKAPKREK